MNEKVAAQARVAAEAMTVVKQQEQLVSCVHFMTVVLVITSHL